MSCCAGFLNSLSLGLEWVRVSCLSACFIWRNGRRNSSSTEPVPEEPSAADYRKLEEKYVCLEDQFLSRTTEVVALRKKNIELKDITVSAVNEMEELVVEMKYQITKMKATSSQISEALKKLVKQLKIQRSKIESLEQDNSNSRELLNFVVKDKNQLKEDLEQLRDLLQERQIQLEEALRMKSVAEYKLEEFLSKAEQAENGN